MTITGAVFFSFTSKVASEAAAKVVKIRRVWEHPSQKSNQYVVATVSTLPAGNSRTAQATMVSVTWPATTVTVSKILLKTFLHDRLKPKQVVKYKGMDWLHEELVYYLSRNAFVTSWQPVQADQVFTCMNKRITISDPKQVGYRPQGQLLVEKELSSAWMGFRPGRIYPLFFRKSWKNSKNTQGNLYNWQ